MSQHPQCQRLYHPKQPMLRVANPSAACPPSLALRLNESLTTRPAIRRTLILRLRNPLHHETRRDCHHCCKWSPVAVVDRRDLFKRIVYFEVYHVGLLIVCCAIIEAQKSSRPLTPTRWIFLVALADQPPLLLPSRNYPPRLWYQVAPPHFLLHSNADRRLLRCHPSRSPKPFIPRLHPPAKARQRVCLLLHPIGRRKST